MDGCSSRVNQSSNHLYKPKLDPNGQKNASSFFVAFPFSNKQGRIRIRRVRAHTYMKPARADKRFNYSSSPSRGRLHREGRIGGRLRRRRLRRRRW